MPSALVVLFVEGDTDLVFFNALIQFYHTASKTPLHNAEVVNLQSVTRYASKMVNKLQNRIIPSATAKGRSVNAVCCSYDTDVFENGIHVVDWVQIEKKVKRLGVCCFYKIGVKSMIEDWLLDDMSGLCSFLKLRPMPSLLTGKTGYEKLFNLFAKAGAKYTKGFSISSFIGYLDICLIREKHKETLAELEKALNVTL